MRFSRSQVLEAAVKAKGGDPGASDFIMSYVAGHVATADRHSLVRIFRTYCDDAMELAGRTGMSRKQIDAEMRATARNAAQGNAHSIYIIRRYLLELAVKAPHALWLSIQDVGTLVPESEGPPLPELPPGKTRAHLRFD